MATCRNGCDCGKHVSRPLSPEARAKISAAAKTRGFNHTADCSCVWCGPNPASTRHGDSPRTRPTPEYSAWRNMKARCGRPNHPRYANYGGRGIAVCDRWTRFEHFLTDVGRRPGPGFSIERIDNNGNYEPGNVRWATSADQMRNTRRTKLTAYAAAEIRVSREGSAALARRYGVSQASVSAVRRGATWI